ncbi:hypothetical protein HX798_18165 [Pseudomonas putida]|uniref:Uncharacterized protein n=1 Tax=Pseudomonas putida TaxID=303 RepID=A0A7Y7ZE34_PSEPU|nr:hypothetical protein [Pseudomonas putida]NWC82194.1 hypothetical protein [Pseudomonas putida]
MSEKAKSAELLLQDLGARKLHLINLVEIIKGNYKTLTKVEVGSINVINFEIRRIEGYLGRRL